MAETDRRRRTNPLLLLGSACLALALAACQVQPVYSTNTAGDTPRPELASIYIDSPGNRTEQVFRNALSFGLTGGAGEAPPRYRLNYRLVMRENPLGVERFTGTPTSYQISGRVSFILEEYDTGDPVMADRAIALASYDRSSQNFANIRAQRDAEDRVTASLAELVETRLAAFMAGR